MLCRNPTRVAGTLSDLYYRMRVHGPRPFETGAVNLFVYKKRIDRISEALEFRKQISHRPPHISQRNRVNEFETADFILQPQKN